MVYHYTGGIAGMYMRYVFLPQPVSEKGKQYPNNNIRETTKTVSSSPSPLSSSVPWVCVVVGAMCSRGFDQIPLHTLVSCHWLFSLRSLHLHLLPKMTSCRKAVGRFWALMSIPFQFHLDDYVVFHWSILLHNDVSLCLICDASLYLWSLVCPTVTDGRWRYKEGLSTLLILLDV